MAWESQTGQRFDEYKNEIREDNLWKVGLGMLNRKGFSMN